MESIAEARPDSQHLHCDAAEVGVRKAFLEFTEADAVLLRELHARLEHKGDAFAEAFYTHLRRFPELDALLGDEAKRERLKAAQSAYFSRLTDGEYGAEYVEHRLHVGLAHQRVGLKPKWYVGAYRKYLSELLPAVFQLLGGDEKKYLATCDALFKIIFFDMALALETYFHAEHQAIVEARTYAEKVIADMPSGLVVVDPALRIRSANNALLDMLGLKSVEACVGRSIAELLGADGSVEREIRDVLQHGVARSGLAFKRQGPQGSSHYLANISRVQTQKEQTLLLFMLQDISAHKAAEENTQKSNERWKDLYNNAPCGYHSLDKDGWFVEINDTELKWLGYEREEVVGKIQFHSLLAPRSRSVFDENFRKFKEDGLMRDLEVEVAGRDGSLLPVLLSATVVRDEDGNFLMSRTIVYNMTERKKLEQELIDHTTRLRDLSQRLVQLKEEEMKRLSSELHEQCSPNLAALKINFKMLAELLPQEADEKISQLLKDTSQLLSETTASIRQVCAELRPSVLDYAGLWKALENYALNFTRRTGIAVHFSVNAGDLKFSKNIETMLFRIAQEALTNCDKHAKAKQIHISFERHGQAAVLTIRDDGVGFDPAALGRNGRDVGLGLLTMRDRAEFVSGRLILDTAPGRGTCIQVELPL